MRTVLGLLLLVMAALPASAGTKPTKDEKVRKLIELTAGEDLAKQTLDQMLTRMRQAEANLPPGYIEKFREIAMKDDLTSMYVKIYVKHLEEKDIDAAIAFFSSPSGRAFAKAQPLIVGESMAGAQAWAEDVSARTLKALGR